MGRMQGHVFITCREEDFTIVEVLHGPVDFVHRIISPICLPMRGGLVYFRIY
jgi:hypothetical protein